MAFAKHSLRLLDAPLEVQPGSVLLVVILSLPIDLGSQLPPPSVGQRVALFDRSHSLAGVPMGPGCLFQPGLGGRQGLLRDLAYADPPADLLPKDHRILRRQIGDLSPDALDAGVEARPLATKALDIHPEPNGRLRRRRKRGRLGDELGR